MTEDMLRNVLDTARAKIDKDGYAVLPEGKPLTLYAAHGGVSLTVAKVESVKATQGVVRAVTAKGETFLALEDLFAVAVEGRSSESAPARKAGFL